MSSHAGPPGLLETLLEEVQALRHAVAALEREPAEASPWLDVNGAAEYLSSTPAAVRKAAARKTIPVHRAGGRLLFDRRELDGFVRAGDAA